MCVIVNMWCVTNLGTYPQHQPWIGPGIPFAFRVRSRYPTQHYSIISWPWLICPLENPVYSDMGVNMMLFQRGYDDFTHPPMSLNAVSLIIRSTHWFLFWFCIVSLMNPFHIAIFAISLAPNPRTHRIEHRAQNLYTATLREIFRQQATPADNNSIQQIDADRQKLKCLNDQTMPHKCMSMGKSRNRQKSFF